MNRLVPLLGAILACCPLCSAQTDAALKDTLFEQVKQFMVNWQRGDEKSLKASLAPEFLYVGENGPAPAKPVVDALIDHCRLVSYRLGEPRMLRTGADAAVLIYSIQQDLTCFGRPEPSDVVNTDTLVRRGGRWLFLMTTSAPLQVHPGPPA